MEKFKGVFTALVTPFIKNEVDYQSLDNLIQQQLAAGINGFVINGTTAESPCLSAQERSEIFKFAKSRVPSGFPLIMGTGTNCTWSTVEQTKKAKELGADAALVVVPYYNKPTQGGMVQHFTQVAQNAGLPVVLYNVPGRTIVGLNVDSFKKLSAVPGIIGVKEATGDIEFGKKVFEVVGPGFLLSSGDDGTCFDFMMAGGHGVISVCSHVLPEKMVLWSEKARAQDPSYKAEFADHAELIDGLYVEPNPIPVKYALKAMGVIRSEELRLPMTALSENLRSDLEAKLKKCGAV